MLLECRFFCKQCNDTPYLLYRRQRRDNPEVYEHVLWPVQGSSLQPPESSKEIKCPVCKGELERKAP